jgi:prolyl-tRNA synthetase
LSAFRVKLDTRTEVTPGFKFNDWELRGVPLRIEIGPKDIENGVVTIARRNQPGKAGKSTLPLDNLASAVAAVLDEIQVAMLAKAARFRDEHIHPADDYASLTQIVQEGWAYAFWCGSAECEAKVKEDTRATTRCIPLDQQEEPGRCVVCGEPARSRVFFARAY